MRRFLRQGERPPKDAVRIEEMLNYFTYRYPEPRRGEPFSITTEMAAAPWAPRHRLVRIGLHSQDVDTESLPASNLVFLIDVSGSMQTPDKLPLVKQSLRLLVNELRPRDRVAIVVYAGAAGLVLPSTPGSEKTRILGAIERLEAEASDPRVLVTVSGRLISDEGPLPPRRDRSVLGGPRSVSPDPTSPGRISGRRCLTT